MKNGQKSSLYGEVSPYSEEIPYSERFSQIHYREYPLYHETTIMFLRSVLGHKKCETVLILPFNLT